MKTTCLTFTAEYQNFEKFAKTSEDFLHKTSMILQKERTSPKSTKITMTFKIPETVPWSDHSTEQVQSALMASDQTKRKLVWFHRHIETDEGKIHLFRIKVTYPYIGHKIPMVISHVFNCFKIIDGDEFTNPSPLRNSPRDIPNEVREHPNGHTVHELRLSSESEHRLSSFHDTVSLDLPQQ